MSSNEKEFDAMDSLVESRSGDVIAFYGVHPWFSSTSGANLDSSLARLRLRLLARPEAHVGEIGLDRRSTDAVTGQSEFSTFQLDLFQRQLELAGELNRVASVHLVSAHGHLLQLLSKLKEWPRAIILHSFAGKPGSIDQLLALEKRPLLYFGFSHCINVSRAPDRTALSLRHLWHRAPDRILLETDLEDAKMMDSSARNMVRFLSQTLELHEDVVAEKLDQNAQKLFQLNNTQD